MRLAPARMRPTARVTGIRSWDGVVLHLGNVPVDSCWQRAQQLAWGLAFHGSVLYVNPNRSFLKGWLNPPLVVESPPSTHHNFRWFNPPAGLPLARTVARFREWNMRRNLARLTEHLHESRLGPIQAVIASFPDQWEMIRQLPASVPVIYDVMDDHTLFLKPHQRPAYQSMHERLLDRAQHVLTTSRRLHEAHAHLGPKLQHLGNGVRTSFVLRCAMAPRARERTAPTFGYVGMISKWFDVAAVRALAEAFPKSRVVLVGPCDRWLPRLPGNIHILPAVRQEELPAILRSFDIGLIPFVPSPTIDAVDPVKLYEYQAAGLPVLASAFAEMKAHRGRVTIYRDPAEAVSQARRMLAEPESPDCVHERQAFAMRNSWEEKAAVLAKLITNRDSRD